MLNEKQEIAFQTFSAWLRDPGNLLAKLKGYAGTGKTFLIDYVLKDAFTIQVLKENKDGFEEMVPFSICVTAPTHQAKKVIMRRTRCQARTIQALLGLAPNTDIENFDINNPTFAIKNNPAMHKFDLIVIDEASMLGTALLGLIIETAMEHGVKVLFVYDSAQLAPIGEDDIPVDFNETILISEELNKVVRTNSTNPILETYTAIRGSLFKTRDAFSHTTRMSDDKQYGEVYMNDLSQFQVRAVKRFWTLFNKGITHTEKVLCWSNKAVQGWNSLIRNSIKNALKLDDEISTFFMKGEPLVSFTSLEDSIVMNSGEYNLDHPKIIEKKWEIYSRDEDGKAILTSAEEVIIKYITGTLRSLENGDKEVVNFVLPTKENYAVFSKAFFWFHSIGIIERKWPAFFAWKDQNLLIRDLVSKKGKTLCKKDFDYGYSVTIHKSQGSTYTNVYIDEPDIDQLEDSNFVRYLYEQGQKKCKSKFDKIKFAKDYPNFETFYNKQQVLKNRLKYVAMTRPERFMIMHTKK